jgi:hypothetical protein
VKPLPSTTCCACPPPTANLPCQFLQRTFIICNSFSPFCINSCISLSSCTSLCSLNESRVRRFAYSLKLYAANCSPCLNNCRYYEVISPSPFQIRFLRVGVAFVIVSTRVATRYEESWLRQFLPVILPEMQHRLLHLELLTYSLVVGKSGGGWVSSWLQKVEASKCP